MTCFKAFCCDLLPRNSKTRQIEGKNPSRLQLVSPTCDGLVRKSVEVSRGGAKGRHTETGQAVSLANFLTKCSMLRDGLINDHLHVKTKLTFFQHRSSGP